jgi:outer membrane translocation and assembly module TamA
LLHPPPSACLALAVALLVGCAASIPKGRYGVSSMEILGTEQLDDEAIEACLATFERESFSIVFGGAPAPQCGVPPFDASRLPVELWTWPWTDWPVFNPTAFERDQDRVERWYQARGYYDARVIDSQVVTDEEEREVEVSLTVREGEPTLIVRIDLLGVDRLPPDVQEAMRDAIELELGEPFDEALFDRSKRAILDVLQEASYARGEVQGKARLDSAQKIARVAFTVVPGPPCRFGDVTVEGDATLPKRPILAAAEIERDAPFSLSTLRDARFAIFGLGPFASVELQHHIRPESPIVDVVIRVTPARIASFGVGVGMTVGGLYAQEADPVSGDNGFAQWDVHLLGKFEHKDFLGGMRSLRIEERPRLIFNHRFPAVADSKPQTPDSNFGNLLTLEVRQPAFIEARTTLVARGRWDLGPDPYGGLFLRDDITVGLGPERRFFEGKLRLATTLATDIFLPREEDPYPQTELAYLYYVAQLDLRDDARHTQSGSYFAFSVQQAGYFLPSDFDYVRIMQDSRGYIALGGGFVLAGRMRLGLMEITAEEVSPSPEAEPEDLPFVQDLELRGPLRHRLRGGGYYSVRGYAPNLLGDVQIIDGRLLSGGLRQWEASLELRIPVTESFGTVVFVDAGDVTREKRWRFEYPQTSVGLGLRYHTFVGPLRFDVALAPEDWQHIGGGRDMRVRDVITDGMVRPIDESEVFGIDGLYGAVSFTIGEAF